MSGVTNRHPLTNIPAISLHCPRSNLVTISPLGRSVPSDGGQYGRSAGHSPAIMRSVLFCYQPSSTPRKYSQTHSITDRITALLQVGHGTHYPVFSLIGASGFALNLPMPPLPLIPWCRRIFYDIYKSLVREFTWIFFGYIEYSFFRHDDFLLTPICYNAISKNKWTSFVNSELSLPLFHNYATFYPALDCKRAFIIEICRVLYFCHSWTINMYFYWKDHWWR